MACTRGSHGKLKGGGGGECGGLGLAEEVRAVGRGSAFFCFRQTIIVSDIDSLRL